VEGEWIVREDAAGDITIERRHEKGDAAMRGTASDLLLALWRRVGLPAIDVIGDVGVAERLIARQRL
jgi:hypothetical protein